MKKTVSIITATLALTFCSAGGLLSKERPNILFIFSDDHSFEAISAY